MNHRTYLIQKEADARLLQHGQNTEVLLEVSGKGLGLGRVGPLVVEVSLDEGKGCQELQAIADEAVLEALVPAEEVAEAEPHAEDALVNSLDL